VAQGQDRGLAGVGSQAASSLLLRVDIRAHHCRLV
jgi:hypothetical protein